MDNIRSKVQTYTNNAQPLFALLRWLGSLDLAGTAQLLGTVFTLLPQLTGGLVLFGDKARPNQSVLGLKLFLRSLIIVDQSKACAPSTTEMCPEAERNDTVFVRFVDRGELLRKLSLGDIWPGRVEDVDHELFTGQETVGNEFSCADGYWCVVSHLEGSVVDRGGVR